jgi:DNA-binding HxlR family transcriptional regulator
MPRTHKKVGTHLKVRLLALDRLDRPRVQAALKVIEGRWKLDIIFRLFGSQVLRYSELDRDLPGVSQKVLTQQLRELERDGIVRRIVHAQVPPRVEYRLTELGKELRPALKLLRVWGELQKRGSA